MTFLAAPLLLLLLAVPLGVVAARRLDRRRRARLASLGSLAPAAARSGQAAPSDGAGPAARRRTAGPRTQRALGALPGALAVAAFACFAIAIARPGATVSLPRVEGTLVLTFDVSGSMAADDVKPSRMDAARTAAKAIVDRVPPGVVVGVVAFSDAGLSVQPPTSDPGVLHAAIDRLGPTHGTSLGEGILAALNAIQAAETDTPASYYSNRSAPP